MPSLWEMLCRTMPFAAVMGHLEWKKKTPPELTLADVRRHVALLPDHSGIYVKLPPVNPELDLERQPLWAFSYSTARPAEVGSVYCRVRDADYVGHQVADRIAWGLEEPGGLLEPEVRVKFRAGADLRLPLTAEYLLWAFRVYHGTILEHQSKLWPLPSNLDTSIVAVFLFDIDPATGQVTRTDFEKVRDPKLREDLREMSRAVKELAMDADTSTELPHEDEEEASASPPPPEERPWGERILRGADFWPEHEEHGRGVPPAPSGLSGTVGDSVDVNTEPARVLVVFSFTTCCERADFEPGGMVGFARCYPHLLVSVTAPVALIEASAHIDRPEKMSKWHEEDRNMTASCCKPPHDGWTEPIGALLVTDANRTMNVPESYPFWSNMFYYYIVDPYLAEGRQRYHVVRNDRPHARESAVPLVKRIVADLWGDLDDPRRDEKQEDGIVCKEARQGMFDNIHLAPRLRLMNVSHVTDTNLKHLLSIPTFPIDSRAKWRLDDIAMAPFCAHDCLHLHWRWGTNATAMWSLGWDATGPHRQAGAPLVPPGQDVWVWFRRRASVTYHVNAQSSQSILGWHVLMHHGFGYAVAISNRMLTMAAMTATQSASRVLFVSPSGGYVSTTDSTAAYYWQARYGYSIVDGEAVPWERLSFPSQDLLNQAIDL